MRVTASCLAIVLCAACARPDAPPPSPQPGPITSAAPAQVRPERVDRVRGDVPAGYEIADLAGAAAPLALWGFRQDPTADPAPCGALADPAAGGAFRGWSASGPGGIVYAVVADAAVDTDPALWQSCDTWTLAAGPASGVVTRLAPPGVPGAVTTGLAADVTTVVEGGTETHSHAQTFVAYLGGHVAHVTVVTDPGAGGPALPDGFAPTLLQHTVAAIRG